MVLNAAVQMLREADELKESISKFKSGTSMLQEHSLWDKQQQLQKIYQKVLVLDLDYALDKKVEQDLWNIGFKQQIEALQAISKDRKNPLRSEGQAMLSWVLEAAAGFYLCLLHQICTTFQLDLPFRRRASLLGSVEGWGAGAGAGAGGCRPAAPAAARYICQHCLVHLGDLARYSHQLRVAHTFYRHALMVSVHSGQPYNQLALLAWRRSRRLAALYWHVRSVLVRAPFPPAPHNLARTLRAAAASPLLERGSLPVVPGVPCGGRAAPARAPPRLDAHSYVSQLIRALHYIHEGDELDTAEELVKSLNSSLSTLIATDSFESMTLIKMAVVVMWCVQCATEELALVEAGEGTRTEAELRAAHLALSLAAGAILALLLPAYSHGPPSRATPAVKVWLEWLVAHAAVLRSAAWAARPALWPALANYLNLLADTPRHHDTDKYSLAPLPEDEELHGFLPLEESLRRLHFPNHAAWDEYGAWLARARSPPAEEACSLREEAGLEERVRAHRLLQLGRRLARLAPHHLSYTEEEEQVRFTAAAAAAGGEQLSRALAELAAGRSAAPAPAPGPGDSDRDSDDDAPAPTPTVISEADFREKVRERRAGILKPQGSLERAREERALATTHDTEECSSDSSKCEDKKERKPRVNIAMAAILRKQEDTNKQVKFVTPPATPESAADSTEGGEDKPKVVQPKAIKSAGGGLPLGRKTGGILSLKDKSGYPHLVNSPPDKDEKRERRPSPPGQPPPAAEPRAAFPGERRAAAGAGAGIRLPVVNPKEIDVRSAALQKQSSRRDLPEAHKPPAHVSGDKRNFLNDLPPRFANQYRYWQAAHEPRDEPPPAAAWPPAPAPAPYPQPAPWWKPDDAPPAINFNYGGMKADYFAPPMNNNAVNPYRAAAAYGAQAGAGEAAAGAQRGALSAADFASSLSGFGSFPAVPYDAAMYPQFSNPAAGYRPLHVHKPPPPPPHRPAPVYRDDGLELGVGFATDADLKRRMAFGDLATDANANRLDQNKTLEGEAPANTYSLFSGAPSAASWGSAQLHPPQSLWSGPGPSPLERLLEQQKQLSQPPAPQ